MIGVIEFLAVLFATGYVAMGIGAVIGLAWILVKWLNHSGPPMWFKWKEIKGFTRLEFIERAVNDMTGIPNKREKVVQTFGPGEGCLALLLFLPIQLIVNPAGFLVMNYRKSALRTRVEHLTSEQRASLASEYMTWLYQ